MYKITKIDSQKANKADLHINKHKTARSVNMYFCFLSYPSGHLTVTGVSENFAKKISLMMMMRKEKAPTMETPPSNNESSKPLACSYNRKLIQ